MKRVLINILQFLLFLGIGLVILFLVFRSQNEIHKNDCCIKTIPQWESIESPEEQQALLKACRDAGTPEQECEPLIDKLINDFKRVNYGWILMVMVAFIISNVNRTYKWLMLLKPLGYQPRFINGFFVHLGRLLCEFRTPKDGRSRTGRRAFKVRKDTSRKSDGYDCGR